MTQNKSIQNILFDLDGTLSDPAEGILKAILHATGQLGLREEKPRELTRFIGPPIVHSFKQRYGLSDEAAGEAVRIYREYYGSQGKFENRLYPGIEELLETLSGKGLHLYVATAKPEGFAREILEHFRIMRYFRGMVGASLDHSLSEKEDIIRLLLANYGLDPATCLMVGDRRFDLEGARKCHMQAIGVLYGHGEEEELKAQAPLALAATVEELQEILLDHSRA